MDKFLEKVTNYKVDNPIDRSVEMGPKVNGKEIENMECLMTTSLQEGAVLNCGGKIPLGQEFEKRFWFEPPILSNVNQDMTIVHEESFGPILPVIKFRDFDEVIGYANDCQYGFAAMVFTNDLKKILKCKDELEFREIYINWGHGEQHPGFHNGYKLNGSGGEMANMV
jgi:lactaldehyde dehydrogenase/glycolaldehyde dehydrogenase